MSTPPPKTYVLRPFAPLSTHGGQRRAHAPQRADLDGLEVRESTFNEWLEAGGERRRKPRDENGNGSR